MGEIGLAVKRSISTHRISYGRRDGNTGSLLAREIVFLLGLLAVILMITGYEMRFLRTQLLIDDMLQSTIHYEAFRELRINRSSIEEAETEVRNLLKKEPELDTVAFINPIGYITFSMMARKYDLLEHRPVDYKTFFRGIGRVARAEAFQELYRYYRAILSDLKYFPVPRLDLADVSYENSWYANRDYGGPRKHEGTDLMASNNLRGCFPVLCMTDGVVEKLGWLEKGGNRIGIRSDSGGYFYYAHLSSYAPELQEGDKVIAGQLLGFMGDSGYGPEGTIGQFAVHLHLGIYVSSDATGTGEMSVNPYWLLRLLEMFRTDYVPVVYDRN